MRSSLYSPISYRKSILGSVLSLILLGILLYAHTFDVPFFFDDQYTIVQNPIIKKLSNIVWLWQFDPSRFLTHFSYALNFHFGSMSPWGYHLVNLLLHISNSILVFFLLIKLLTGANSKMEGTRAASTAFVAALIFLAHPLQTQAVTYISQRATILAALFYFLSLYLYVGYRQGAGGWRFVVSVLLMGMGVFTKPIIVTLPLAIFLLEIFFLNRREDRAWSLGIRLVPFFVLAFAVPVLLILWRHKVLDLGYLSDLTRETQKYGRYEYLLTQFNVLMTYIRLLFLPVAQSLDYDYPIARSFFTFPTWLSFGALVSILGYGFSQCRRNKLIAFAIFWFFMALSIESSIFPISDVIFEHRLYVPMVGFAMMMSVLVHAVKTSGRRTAYIVFLLISFYSILTVQRNEEWRDIKSLHIKMAQRFPNKGRLHNNLGNIYVSQGEYERAREEYFKAIELGHPKAYNNLANTYLKNGEVDQAIVYLEKAIEALPFFVDAHYNLANIYMNKKEPDPRKAFEHFSKAVKINPTFSRAVVGLGRVHMAFYDFKRAQFYYDVALSMDPSIEDPYMAMGDLYLSMRDYVRAGEFYRQALQRNPHVAAVRNNLGNVYFMTKQMEKAQEEYERVIRETPEYEPAYRNLGKLLMQKGEHARAGALLEKASVLRAQQDR